MSGPKIGDTLQPGQTATFYIAHGDDKTVHVTADYQTTESRAAGVPPLRTYAATMTNNNWLPDYSGCSASKGGRCSSPDQHVVDFTTPNSAFTVVNNTGHEIQMWQLNTYGDPMGVLISYPGWQTSIPAGGSATFKVAWGSKVTFGYQTIGTPGNQPTYAVTFDGYGSTGCAGPCHVNYRTVTFGGAAALDQVVLQAISNRLATSVRTQVLDAVA